MSNPIVRQNLHFYPEDVGKKLEQAWHGARWRTKIDPDLLTPMIRVGPEAVSKDYYIWEPTVLKNNLGVCMPIRWFIRNGGFFADAYRLRSERDATGKAGWTICDWDRLVVSADDLELNLPEFRATFEFRRIPSPDCIHGEWITIAMSTILRYLP